MKIELEYEEVKRVRTLVQNRLSDLRIELTNSSDSDDIREIIGGYKELLHKIDEQLLNEQNE